MESTPRIFINCDWS